jgi:hypothetical protein
MAGMFGANSIALKQVDRKSPVTLPVEPLVPIKSEQQKNRPR